MPSNDILSVELEIIDGQADATISKTKQKLDDFVKDVEKKSPQIKFSVPGQSFIDLDKLEKRSAETYKRFSEIASVRLNNGQINNLTREMVTAMERSRQLSIDISNIKRELANPNRKSSIAFLTDELKAAEREAEQLDRKLRTVVSDEASASGGSGGSRGHGLSLSGIAEGRQLRGAGPLFRAAGLYEYGLDESIFNAANSARIAAGVASSSLAIFAALAVAGVAVVEVSRHIREEAEKRYKVEEMIAGAMNKQILSQREALANYQKQEENAAGDRQFGRDLKNSSPEELQRRLETLKKLRELDPTGENTQRTQAQILAINAELDGRQQKTLTDANAAFDARWEAWKKSQEQAAEAEKKFQKSVEEGKAKVDELRKGWTSAFDALEQKFSSDNPFALFLAKSQTETDKLKEALKGLPPELQKVASAMQAVSEGREAFGLRLDSALGAANLRSQAAGFTDPTQAEMQARLNADIAEFQRSSNSRNPEVMRRFAERQAQINNFGRDRQNKNLQDEYDTIYDRRRQGFDEGVADKRFISLTNGLNPDQLTSQLRREAADARLREAGRTEAAETQAKEDRKAELEIRKKFSEAVDKLDNLAQKGGLNAVKIAIETSDKSPTTQTTATAASPSDVSDHYGLAGGSGGLTSF